MWRSHQYRLRPSRNIRISCRRKGNECISNQLRKLIFEIPAHQCRDRRFLAKGICERIGIDGRLTYQPAGGEKEKSDKPMPTHTEAIQYVIEALTDPDKGVVKSLRIGAVGHRIVHGGEKFASSVVITDEVKKAVEECNELAPLPQPFNVIGVFFLTDPLPYGLQRMVSFYPFFLAGYYTSSYSFSFCRKPWFRLLSVLILLGLFDLMQWKGTSVRTDLFTSERSCVGYRGQWLLAQRWNLSFTIF